MFPLRRGKGLFCIQIALPFPGTCDTYFPLITLVQHLLHVKKDTFFEHAFSESYAAMPGKQGFLPYFRYNFVCSQLRRRGLNILSSIFPHICLLACTCKNANRAQSKMKSTIFFVAASRSETAQRNLRHRPTEEEGFFLHSKIQTVFEFQNKIVFVQRPAALSRLVHVVETMHCRR